MLFLIAFASFSTTIRCSNLASIYLVQSDIAAQRGPESSAPAQNPVQHSTVKTVPHATGHDTSSWMIAVVLSMHVAVITTYGWIIVIISAVLFVATCGGYLCLLHACVIFTCCVIRFRMAFPYNTLIRQESSARVKVAILSNPLPPRLPPL